MLLRAIAAIHLLSALLEACSCIGPLTPCASLSRAEVAFVGTALTDLPEHFGVPSDPQLVRVDYPLHGLNAEQSQIRIFTRAGTSCAVRLKAGMQYFFFAQRKNSGPDLTISTCSGTLAVSEQTKPWLEEFQSTFKRKGNYIQGNLAVLERWPPDRSKLSSPAGVPVILTSPTHTARAISDESGSFRFDDLPPGPYSVTAAYASQAAVFSLGPINFPITEITVPSVGCIDLNGAFPKAVSLRGKVHAPDGKPLPNALVTLLHDTAPGYQPAILPQAITNENGDFAFVFLPGGRYRIAVGHSQHEAKQNFRATFYPSTLSRASAAMVETPYSDGQSLSIKVLPLPTMVNVRFKIPSSIAGTKLPLRLHFRSATSVRSLLNTDWYVDCERTPDDFCSASLPRDESFEASIESPVQDAPLGKHRARQGLTITAQP